MVRRAGQSGFIFPFALMLLVVFSFLISMMAGHIGQAQKRARYLSQQTLYTLGSFSVEQEIIFRAIVEYYAKEYSGGLAEKTKKYTYRNIFPPQNDWRMKSEKYVWGGMYGKYHPLPESAKALEVSIQDNAGLLDMNYMQKNYLEYIASLVGVAEGEEKRAVDTLMDYVDEDRTPHLRGQENTSYDSGGYPANTELRTASEICGLPVWRDIEMCLDRARLHSFLVAGHGGAVAFNAMPKNVLAALVPESEQWSSSQQQSSSGQQSSSEQRPLTEQQFYAKSLNSWVNTQRVNGFHNKNYGLNGSGLDLTVGISQPNSAVRKRFRVIIHGVQDPRPYTIVDESFEYVPPPPVAQEEATGDDARLDPGDETSL